jgi:hypothetical protein
VFGFVQSLKAINISACLYTFTIIQDFVLWSTCGNEAMLWQFDPITRKRLAIQQCQGSIFYVVRSQAIYFGPQKGRERERERKKRGKKERKKRALWLACVGGNGKDL